MTDELEIRLGRRTAYDAEYERRVGAVADALHQECLLEWQAIDAVDPSRLLTLHGVDAHYGRAHDLVRRLSKTVWPLPGGGE
jgi:hypothetical protein